MMIKLFGIGNILLSDDAIGVRVLERLQPDIHKLSPSIEAIVGETDALFCLECITPEDFIIIIDSTYLNTEPGTVSYFKLSECDAFVSASSSSHELTLLHLLRVYYPNLQGYLIGIEIERIDFSFELSLVLQNRLDAICTEILHFLEGLILNKNN
jgi:hydrogenase maturation protease